MSNAFWNRIPPPVRWIGAIVAALFLLIVVLGLIDWNGLRGPLSRIASRDLGRQVVIGGPLHVHLLSATPSVDISGLTIANPDWAARVVEDGWEPRRPPLTVAELRERGLNEAFAGYMRRWSGFVAD